MTLSVRPPISSLPSYSLTGDLLGFLRCGLQYRYTSIGNLPSSHPIQLWFGQFIHAVLEESFRLIQNNKKSLPPWQQPDVDQIMDRIDRRLAARNIQCWDSKSEALGRARATSAVNELGPLLFPLIAHAEVRVRGARKLPSSITALLSKGIDRYEMQGVIDVVSHVQLLDPKLQSNRLLKLILENLPTDPPNTFEVIVDYKGMKRPDLSPQGTNLWNIYQWQVHTYAHLRSLLTTEPIIAGVLIYLNELIPTKTDFYDLRKAHKSNSQTVLLPSPGSHDENVLLNWKPTKASDQPPLLSLNYRLKRAVRVLPVNQNSINKSLQNFDQTVTSIEMCIATETRTAQVINSWPKNPSDPQTCAACDVQTFCPAFTKALVPRLPAV